MPPRHPYVRAQQAGLLAVLVLVATCVALSTAAEAQPGASLTPAFRRALDQAQPGWQVAPVSAKARTLTASAPMVPEPNVLIGDFDGNGVEDRTVLVSYPSPSGGRRSQVFVLLASRDGIRSVRVGEPRETDPNRYLFPRTRGTKLMDLETNREFVCEHDAVGVHYWCCGCTTHVFANGRWDSYWTCD